MKRVFSTDPANEQSKDMFYSGNDQEHRCIGHLRGDFGASGEECWTSFWPHEGAVLTGADCRDEINALVLQLTPTPHVCVIAWVGHRHPA